MHNLNWEKTDEFYEKARPGPAADYTGKERSLRAWPI